MLLQSYFVFRPELCRLPAAINPSFVTLVTVAGSLTQSAFADRK
jgi:hypothetical protein